MAYQLHGNPTPRMVLTRPCSLPATPHRLNTAARPDCDCKGVSPRLCIGPRAALPASWPGGYRSPRWRVMAHRPYGSAQTGMYPSALCCAGICRAFFVKEQRAQPRGKGCARLRPAWVQFRLKLRMATISFVSIRRRISSSTARQGLPFWSYPLRMDRAAM